VATALPHSWFSRARRRPAPRPRAAELLPGRVIATYKSRRSSCSSYPGRAPAIVIIRTPALSFASPISAERTDLAEVASEWLTDLNQVVERQHWFLTEQREEVSSMSALLAVVERAAETNLLLAEDYLARNPVGDQGVPEAGAPPAAGGAL